MDTVGRPEHPTPAGHPRPGPADFAATSWPAPSAGPAPGAPPPGVPPSGLFPAAPRPARPTYREPFAVRGAAVASGAGAAAAWLLFFGLLGRDLRGYVWWTVLAGAVAWLAALTLTRYGDRGVAVGIAIVTAVGWSVAAVAVAVRWATTGDWPLW